MGALAGCSFFPEKQQSTPTETPTTAIGRTPARGHNKRDVPSKLEDEYESAHNVVQLGVDHTGRHPVGDTLTSAVDDGTALYFPRGEYKLTDPTSFDGFRNVAFVGNRALVRPPDGYADELFQFGTDSGATELRFEGIDFDLTANHTGARPIHAEIRDGLNVSDVTVYGRQDVNQDSMRFDVTSKSGTGRVEGLRLPDGGATAFPNTGIYVGEQSVGRLTFTNCRIAGFPDNGLYASPARGPVIVDGGIYANNGISSVRVSGPSRIDGVRVVCDTNRNGLQNMRGIRLREGRNIRVRNADVAVRSVTSSDAAITMAEWLDGATIENTTVRVDADDVTGILAKQPTRKRRGGDKQSRITLNGVTVVGRAANEAAITANGRNGCQFDGVCIQQRGRNRDGIVLRDSTGAVLTDTTIDVTGKPLVLERSRTKRQQIRVRQFGSNC
ncbi:MAG: hypothetical protein ABEI77_09015 [Halorientalis sp.]